MNNLVNDLARQGPWLAAVAAAGHGLAWAAPAALALFPPYPLQRQRRAHADATLLALPATGHAR